LYEPAQHHWQIAEKLEAVERGEIKRLMIFMPPRHGKSELASRRFPAWYLGRNPNKQIIGCSYSTDLAVEFGRDVRNIFNMREMNTLFGVSLRADSKAAGRWNTSQGGCYLAAGVDKGITGFGANILLIDDPIKDRKEAESETVRQNAWDWYTSTAYTRLMPGGAVVVIQTRWHADDLAGRLLEAQEHGGDQWEVLSLQAINDDGQALWPEWYDVEQLSRIKGVIGPRDWSALYQQEPMPQTGDFFQMEWFEYYDELPKQTRFYITSDYAVTAGGGDYTVHLVWCIDAEENIYIVDMWRGQTDTNTWINALIGLINRYRPDQIGEENGQIIKSVGPFIEKKMQESSCYCYRQQYPSVADKATRAQSFRGRASQGKVFLKKGADWLDVLLKELLTFPAGKHDDIVDTCSLIGRMLQEMKPYFNSSQTTYESDFNVFGY
jgi:predicted phage terminase large subunit-like protein